MIYLVVRHIVYTFILQCGLDMYQDNQLSPVPDMLIEDSLVRRIGWWRE